MILDAPIRRFTSEEYHRMAEVGILQYDERVELLSGEIISMSPIGPFHSWAVSWLDDIFHQLSRKRWITHAQTSLRIEPNSEPQPDLVLLRLREKHYQKFLPTAADAFLVVEISDTTLLMDRGTKVPLYAGANVPEVWIVNVPQRLVEVYRRPEKGVYTERFKVHPGEPLAPELFPDAVIDTATLLA